MDIQVFRSVFDCTGIRCPAVMFGRASNHLSHGVMVRHAAGRYACSHVITFA